MIDVVNQRDIHLLAASADNAADQQYYIYRMAGNFGGKIFWRIAENMSFGGIYFGG